MVFLSADPVTEDRMMVPEEYSMASILSHEDLTIYQDSEYILQIKLMDRNVQERPLCSAGVCVAGKNRRREAVGLYLFEASGREPEQRRQQMPSEGAVKHLDLSTRGES